MQIAIDYEDKKREKTYQVGDKVLDTAFFQRLERNSEDVKRRKAAGEDRSVNRLLSWLDKQ